MSQQGRKRSRSRSPNDGQPPVKTSRHEVQNSETAQQEQSQDHAADLRKYDDDGLLIIRPPPPITNWRFGVKEPSPPPELTEEEREVEELWAEFEVALRSDGSSDVTPPPVGCEQGAQEARGDGISSGNQSMSAEKEREN